MGRRVSKEHLGAEKGQVGACRVARPGGRVPEGADTPLPGEQGS